MAEKGYIQYFDAIESLQKKIRTTQGPNIEKAAHIVAEALVNDGLLHVYGAGHSACITEEIFFRAGTLAPINQILDLSLAGAVNAWKSAYMERLEGIGEVLYQHSHASPQDVFLVISNSGRNAAPIEMAREAQKHGHKVIVETCAEFCLAQSSRHSSGKRLLDYADVILDNQGVFGDCVVQPEGFPMPMGPASGVLGSFLIHAMLVQVVFTMREMGVEQPPVFMHGNLDGGMEFNQQLLDQYWPRIRNW
ncbi:MAG: hypothetical protein PWQ55_679 [Chloroflexota bacterium]|nr:hypothetical protein [Chloroflexota bacterium]